MTRASPVVPPRIIPGSPPEIVVYDEPHDCPYVTGRVAVLPLRVPSRRLTGEELDERLAAGDRRQGMFLYRTACPSCSACEPIRLDVNRFEPNRAQRRVLARGDREISLELGPPVLDPARVELYNRHKRLRGLGDGEIDLAGYRQFLVMTCCDSFEIRYRVRNELVGVALADRSAHALSAVYCFYDPAYERLGLGTYSILKQVELCRSWGLSHLYLGLYIGDCERMRYKARFFPHERLLGGNWAPFERPRAEAR
ncbi:MAG TPA: arginyltransferase [Polyangiaceae bacterium]